MGKRSRLLGVIGLLAAVAAIAFVCFRGDKSQELVLKDGSVLRITKIEYGNLEYYHRASLNPWQQAVAKFLPSAISDGVGWQKVNTTFVSGKRTNGPTLGISVVREVKYRSPNAPLLELLDAAGHRYGMDYPSLESTTTLLRGRGRRQMLWSFKNIPPPDKLLVLRFIFYDEDSSGGSMTNGDSVEVTAPNPLAKPSGAK